MRAVVADSAFVLIDGVQRGGTTAHSRRDSRSTCRQGDPLALYRQEWQRSGRRGQRDPGRCRQRAQQRRAPGTYVCFLRSGRPPAAHASTPWRCAHESLFAMTPRSHLRRLALQLSSTLHWTSARIADVHQPALSETLIASDMDHTGSSTRSGYSAGTSLSRRSRALHIDLTYEGTAAPIHRAVGEDRHRGGSSASFADWDRVCGGFHWAAGPRERGVVPGGLRACRPGRRRKIFHRGCRTTASRKYCDCNHQRDGRVLWRSSQSGCAGWKNLQRRALVSARNFVGARHRSLHSAANPVGPVVSQPVF